MGIILVFTTCIISTTICFIGSIITSKYKNTTIYIISAISLFTYISIWILGIYNWIIIDSLLILISIFAGRIFGYSITTKQALIVFCITFSIIDIFSFLFGPTKIILSMAGEGKKKIIQYLAITIPIYTQQIPLFGIGDTIIISSIYSSFIRIGYKGWWIYLIPLFGFLVSVTIGLLVGGIFALPFIGGITLIYLLIKKSK